MHGGLAQAVELIVRHGRDRGLVAGVITPHAGSESEIAMRRAGADTYAFGRPFTYSKLNPVGSLRAMFDFARRLKDVIAEFRPDVIETNHATVESFTSFAQARIGNTLPRVFCQRANLRVYRGKVSAVALRRALRSVSVVISVSPFSDHEYSRILGVPAEKLVHISDCAEPHRLWPDAASQLQSIALRESWGGGPDDVLVGIVGAILPNKNQAMLIEAAREICRRRRNARFVIAGNPDSPRYCRRLVARANKYGLRDRVVFTGFVDKHQAIPALDVVVSLSFNEGFGLSVLEAAACGKPVVATRSGGPEHIIEDGRSGFLIPENDVRALAERLIALIDDPVRRDAMGKEGKQRACDVYDPVDKVENRIRLYERLAKDA
jgi:glycosyltransferase involved in cell wall biosynthesis